MYRVRTKGDWGREILQWVNLRPEESERTLLMFAFYTTTSIGLLWFESSAVALFLKRYGAELLPAIYIASAVLGSGLGFLYSWLQRILPLRSVLVAIALLMAFPLLLFRVGLEVDYFDGLVALGTVFLLRLWMDGINVLNDLNTSIAANQLFNIREIKRTYPLISSGVLVADVLSGFSLPLLVIWIGLPNVIVLSCLLMLLGALVLYYLGDRYQQSFPNSPARQLESQPFTSRRVGSTLSRYVVPLFAFFIIGQVVFLLVDFQYLSELEQRLDTQDLASFLGLFSGILGLFELSTQWFLSSRAIERLGVFIAAMLLPASLLVFGLVTLTGIWNLFIGLILLKFIDELLRYTLIASVSPVLFQPLPESIRSSTQAFVKGIAENVSTGATGLGILGLIGLCYLVFPQFSKESLFQLQGDLFVVVIVISALIWLLSAWLLRSSYVSLLVQSASSERLGFSDVDLRAFKRAVVEALDQPGTEADKRSCIQLLYQIDPTNVGDVLAPLLVNLAPALQRQSLEAMLQYPNLTYLPYVQELIETKPNPEVLAIALRYLWLTQTEPDISTLKPYLHNGVDPIVRGTAATLILRRGTPTEKAEATNTLRRMLTSKRERERVMGCRALGEADYLQALRLYIPQLLQDESLRVRCALLEVIAATRLEEYYPSLVRGLHYKSTREAARAALVRIGDEGLPLLLELAEDIHKPDLVRSQAWSAMGEIATRGSLDLLLQQLIVSWGTSRRNILRILLKMPQEVGIEGVLDSLGRSGVEMLIKQELLLLGQIYAALVDLSEVSSVQGTSIVNGQAGAETLRAYLPQFSSEVKRDGEDFNSRNSSLFGNEEKEKIKANYAGLLLNSLQDTQIDSIERCFLLMKFLYPNSAIQAAAFNLESDSRSNIALGLEILDNTLDIPQKRVLLGILDRRSAADKLAAIAEIQPYRPMSESDRLRRLVELRHFLSDWALACCFHLARTAHISLTTESTLVCLRHPTGFVREAVLAYLKAASPRACMELLPALKNDPDRLVAAQVQQMMGELGTGD